MENELLKIFDENQTEIGIATREEVHKQGYWHETFHCWFIHKADHAVNIYFQLRSHEKKDYPNLLDITAAGHILSHETIFEGVREVQEELGIDVAFDRLTPIGIIPYCVVKEGFIDRELAHVFLYCVLHEKEEFTLQTEEVAGIFSVELEDCISLWSGDVKEVSMEGFDFNNISKTLICTKNDFVPHEDSYYKAIIESIKRFLG